MSMKPKSLLFTLLTTTILVSFSLVIALLGVIDLHHRSNESVFGVTPDIPRHLYIESDIFDLDPIRFEAVLQVTVRPGPELHGLRASAPASDIVLTIRSGDIVQDLVFPANQAMTTREIRVELEEGTIQRYPFDRYTTTVYWTARQGNLSERGPIIPIRMRSYATSPGFSAHLTDGRSNARSTSFAGVALAIDATRPVLIRWFATMLYISMLVVGIGALVVGSLMLARIRRVEPPLLGALAGMMFAVPVIRNALPGGPPVGITADLMVFLWSEIAVVTGLSLGIISWARFGNKPGT
jgi:hypothetical protein